MENTSVNINTGHNYKRKIPVLTGRTKFCIPRRVCFQESNYEVKGKKVWMLLLAYVDDLMIACKDREAALNLVERLGRSVQIKVKGILSRDKKVDFLGRVIQKIEYGLLLGLPEG